MMNLQKIKLTNFEQFENYEVTFDSLNFITGRNGSGKTTLAVDALYFALYGFSTKELLSDVPTRNKSKTCTVDVLIEENEHKIRIIRHFPLKLSIWQDNQLLNLSTAEANKWIVDRFGDRLFFSKFRIMDAYNKETNFLEEGQVALKRIIFAGSDDYFNKIRTRLSEIKLERERLNRDTCVVYKCFPSEKRLKMLITNLVDISNSLVIANNEISQGEKELRNSEIKIASNNDAIKSLNSQISNIDSLRSSYDSKLNQSESRHIEIQRTVGDLNKQVDQFKSETMTMETKKICYVCKKPLEEKSANDIRQEREKKISLLLKQLDNIKNEDIEICNNIPVLKENIIKEKLQKVEEFRSNIERLQTENVLLIEDIKMEEEILAQDKESRDKLIPKKERIQELKMKLEARLKQKEFIYTENDILIAKKAIEELDKMSSYYLVETVQSLEPIINSVLTKINYSVKFDVDIKGKFNIVLTKNDVVYKYKDLSGGERFILQIAFKIALLLQQNKTGILIADEGMSSFDSENLQHIFTIFEDLPFQLIIILHRFDDFPENANVIRLGE